MKTRIDVAVANRIGFDLDLTEISTVTQNDSYDVHYENNAYRITIKDPASHVNVRGNFSSASLTIESAGVVTLNADSIKAVSVAVKAKDICIDKKIDSALLFLEAENTIVCNVSQSGQVVSEIKASNIINRHLFQAEHLHYEAIGCVANAGQIRSISHGNIESNRLNNTGAIFSDNKLEIDSKQIIVGKNARVIAQGESTMHASDSMTLDGNTFLEHGNVTVGNQLRVEGELHVKKMSSLAANMVDIKGTCDLQESTLETELLTTRPEARLEASLGSTLTANWLLTDGSFDLNQSQISANRFSSNGMTSIHHSVLGIKDFISRGDLTTTYSTLHANRLDFSGPYQFIASDVTAQNVHQYNNDGSLVQSSLHTDHLQLDNKASLVLEKTNVEASFVRLNGGMTLDESQICGQVVEQHGNLKLKNKAKFIATGTLQSHGDSQLQVQNSVVDASLALMNGELNAKNSVIIGNDLVLNNRTMLKDSVVAAQSSLSLEKQRKNVIDSLLSANALYLNGYSQVENSKIYSVDNTTLLPFASLNVVNTTVHSDGPMSIFGGAILNDSYLKAKALCVYNDLDVARSDVAIDNKVSVEATGYLGSTNSRIIANSFSLSNKMDAKNTLVSTKEGISFDHAAKANIQHVAMKTDQAITISSLSELHGEEVQLKAETLHNKGLLDVNNLDIDVELLHNDMGKIDGHDSLHIIADKLFCNFMGDIYARQVSIHTGASLNIMGSINGQDHLDLNTLMDVNFYGLQCSYDANLNSLVNLNTGLVLPAMPSSFKAALTPNLLLGVSRAILTNAFPSVRNAINLAYFTAPLLWTAGSKIYDIAKYPEKSWRDLLPVIDIDKLRLTDVISVAVGLKNIGMSGQQLYGTISGMSNESQSYSFEKIGKDFKTLSPDSFINDIAYQLGPTIRHDSLYQANMGVIASQNIMQNNLVNTNNGIVAGAQSFYENSLASSNHGLMLADQLMLQSGKIDNSGMLIDNSTMVLEADYLNNNGLIKAKNAIFEVDSIDNTGKLLLSTAALKGGSLDHLGDIEVHGAVVMHADQSLNLNQCHIVGDGDLSLSAATINFKNAAIHVDGLLIDDPGFKAVDDLFHSTNDFKNIHAHDLGFITKQPIAINSKINSTGNIYMEASSINVNADVKSNGNLALLATDKDMMAKANLYGSKHLLMKATDGSVVLDHHDFLSMGTVNILAHKNLLNQGGTIHGNNVYLTAESGDIINSAGKISSDTCLQAIAKKSVVNEAGSSDAWGGYDYYKIYNRGEMIGGVGDGISPGLYIKAGDTIINDTSTMGALGKVYLDGEKGVIAKPSTHQYIAYQHTKRRRFGRKTTTTVVDTQIEKPHIYSTHDQVIIKSGEGTIQTTGADIIAKKGADLYAKGDIRLYDVQGFRSFDKKKRGYFGLSHDHHYDSHDTSVPTVLANIDPAMMRIHSAASDIVIKGSYLYNPESQIELVAKNIDVIPTVLQSHYLDQQSGWKLKIGNYTVIGDKPSSTPLFHADPLWSDVSRLMHGHGAADGLVNTAQLGIDTVNTVNAVSQALENGTLMQLLAERQGLFSGPKVSVGKYKNEKVANSESLATGGIVAGDLIINVDNKVTIAAVPVDVSHNMAVNAKEFIQTGVTLHHSSKETASEWSVSPSQGPMHVDVSVSGSSQSMRMTETAPQILTVDGTLAVNADQWAIKNSEVNVGQLAGKVDHLDITSTLDSIKTESKSYHASTTGDVGFTKDSSYEQYISHAAVLTVHHLENNQFTVGNVSLVDGQVQSASGSVIDLHPQQFSSSHQTMSKKSHQQGLSLNLFNPVPMRQKQPDINDMALTKVARDLSEAVYSDDTRNEDGYALVGQSTDAKTGSVISVYLNDETNTVFFAFRGTKDFAAMASDDVDIMLGKTLQSENSQMWQEALSQINVYCDKGYKVYLTGHSRGASQASLASSKTSVPAIVFDNPGIYDPNHLYDFSRVTSVQSTPNIINHAGEMTGRFYNQGNVVQLNPTVLDQVIQLGGEVIEKKVPTVLPTLIYGAGQTLWSHSINHIEERLPEQVDNHHHNQITF